jgi:hypothetical protein
MNLTATHAGNEAALKVIYGSLELMCKVFNSLNSQDLPEFFEDNMSTWMTTFHSLLITDVPCLKTPDDDEPGMMEMLRSQICDNISLYAQKYDEEFAPFMEQFVTAVWGLLVNTGQQPKFDSLVTNALTFLSTVAGRQQYRNLFEDPNVLASICEKVIVPNMDFRSECHHESIEAEAFMHFHFQTRTRKCSKTIQRNTSAKTSRVPTLILVAALFQTSFAPCRRTLKQRSSNYSANI